MSALSVFLKDAHHKSLQFENYEDSKLMIVMGNSACDLDSAACTLAVALFKSLADREKQHIILPVFNLGREEMDYKTEVIYFLKKLGISLDDLIYRGDIDFALKLAMGYHKLDITLVDHHLDPTLNKAVKQIIDHHVVQAPIEPHVALTISPVGSCSTLVFQLLLTRPEILKAMVLNYTGVIEMCFGAIILDTVNFSSETNRFTELDIKAARIIETTLGRPKDDPEARRVFHEQLLAARNDVSKLSPYQQLHKDYKMVSSLPVCGLTMLVQEFVRVYYPDAEKALMDFAVKTRSTELVLIGMSTIEGSVRRDIAFYSTPNSVRFRHPELETKGSINLEEHLAKLEDPNFKLCHLKFPINDFPGLRIYWQHNAKLTRKHLIPAIKDVQDLVFPPIC